MCADLDTQIAWLQTLFVYTIWMSAVYHDQPDEVCKMQALWHITNICCSSPAFCGHDLRTCLNLPVFLLCSHDIRQLARRKHVYHVTPEEGKSWVAKVVTTPYPWQLHEELSDLGLAPKLAIPVEEYPGRVQVINMDYLDPADGWMRLERFTGDWDALHEVAMEALKSLQTCLDGKAVHGDLNPGNLLVRYVMSTGSTLGLSCIAGCP
jgi:hypothetical protein